MADIGRAKGIGYNPDYSLDEGLAETIQWFRDGTICDGAHECKNCRKERSIRISKRDGR
jgi:hypothetical protein